MARARTTTTPAKPAAKRRESPVRVANRRMLSERIPSVTAAATVTQQGPGTSSRGAQPLNNPSRVRQEQAWAYFDSLGVVKYAAFFYGKSLARIRLIPGIIGEDGRVQDAIDDEGPIPEAPQAEEVATLLRGLRAPLGGQPSLLRSFGVNLFVAGECNLVGQVGPRGDEEWEVFSTDELRKNSEGRYERFSGPGSVPEVLPDGTDVSRIWQPHERFKRQADSSLLGVLDTAEELVLLNREIRAEALSRIPNGILAIADELSYSAAAGNVMDGSQLAEGDIPPDDEEEDPFITDLIEQMMTAIRDKSSAAAMIPIILRGPADAIEKGLKHLLLARPESARAILKRREALEMFAMGIDLPVEVVLGHQQTTFANAFQIDEDTYKVHILPMMQIVADGLTHGYLWPKMAQARGLDPDQPFPEEVTRNVVSWDATHLVSHPDRSKEATEGLNAYAISWAAWRRACGFGESDRPDENELGQRINITRLSNVRESIRLNVADAGTPLEALPPSAITEALAASAAGPDAAALLAARIVGAADVSIERAVDRLGSRLRNAARKNGHASSVDGIANADVAVTLGPSVCAALLKSEPTFPGEFGALARKACEWAQAAGVADPADFARRVAEVTESVAERRLYGDDRIGPEQFLALVAEARGIPIGAST